MRASYVNKKQKTIYVHVTTHAVARFTERYRLIRGAPVANPKETLIEYFNASTRRTPQTEKERQRLKRYGTDTLFFKFQDFTFVVHDGCIVTVEITAKGKRGLNKL